MLPIVSRALLTLTETSLKKGLKHSIRKHPILKNEAVRYFHISQKREINPLLPFDITDTLENEDLEQKNKKLEKEKKKIEKEKKKQKGKEKEDDNNENIENNNNDGNENDNSNNNDKTNKTSPSNEKTNNGNGVKNNSGNSNNTNKSSGNNGNDGNNGNGNRPLSPIEEFIMRQREKEEKQQEKEEEEREKEAERKEENWSRLKSAIVKCIETGLITFSSLLVLAISGLTYHELYKRRVLDKISDSFDEGDPTFQLQKHRISVQEKKYWVEREQQKFLDDVVTGKITGRYLLLVGEKGVGKTSSIMESIRKVNGKNCAIIDCSSDLELMRIRIGAALNFEFHEDYIGALFSIRGPRDTTALLDIERAFGKLEEVALKRVSETKEPLVLVFNDMHLIKDDEEGIKLVELLQQKAESLSGSRLATIIFNSDDYWVYENLKKLATRLEVVHFKDLNREEAIRTLKVARMKFFNDTVSDEDCNQIYNLIGGRPQHISHVAGHQNMITACNSLIDREKTWFLNQCGLLGEEMDDDVMESGKFSTSAMLLMREFVEMDRKRLKYLTKQNIGINKIEHELPELPLWRARQIMTRPDYIKQYDSLNIFTIDSHSRVRADSVPMMRGFHEIASQPGFDDLLTETIMRVADIESLNRTREVVAKDLVLGGRYKIEVSGGGNALDNNKKFEIPDNSRYQFTSSKELVSSERHPHLIPGKYTVSLEGGTKEIFDEERSGEDDDDDTIKLEEYDNGAHRQWWKKRLHNYNGYLSKADKEELKNYAENNEMVASRIFDDVKATDLTKTTLRSSLSKDDPNGDVLDLSRMPVDRDGQDDISDVSEKE